MKHSWIFLLISFEINFAFIPHPAIRTDDSITHTEITQAGFIRSLGRYLFETKSIQEYEQGREYTIDDLYALIHSTWTKEEILHRTYPLKSILDTILAENALVDVDQWTKKLAAAHFDSEAFLNGSRRILKLRRIIVGDVLNQTKDLKQAGQWLGQLLHTLQDFYSHSDWVELGKTDINVRIGLEEDIGSVAKKNQSACMNEGCTRIKTKCNLLQKIILNKCPLVYYECKNNIRKEIVEEGLLTSGYSVNQHNEDDEPILKPTDVEKCSHGSVLDTSSHLPAIGGINKDTTSPVFSPHFDLHFEAVKFAVTATERFFNDLRKDLGDKNFDRLFAIHPTNEDFTILSTSISDLREFQFFSPSISSGLNIGSILIKHRWKKIKSIFHDKLMTIAF